MKLNEKRIKKMKEYLKENETPGLDLAFKAISSDNFFVAEKERENKISIKIEIEVNHNQGKNSFSNMSNINPTQKKHLEFALNSVN